MHPASYLISSANDSLCDEEDTCAPAASHALAFEMLFLEFLWSQHDNTASAVYDVRLASQSPDAFRAMRTSPSPRTKFLVGGQFVIPHIIQARVGGVAELAQPKPKPKPKPKPNPVTSL